LGLYNNYQILKIMKVTMSLAVLALLGEVSAI
jgi:hypothetical protein